MAALRLRLAEHLASLSLAMDLGTGQPMEWVMKCCLMGIRLAEVLGLSEPDRREVYYLSLLRHLGCTASASRAATIFGSEMYLQESFTLDTQAVSQVLSFMIRSAGKDQPLVQRARYFAKALTVGQAAKEADDRSHCEVAVQLARRLAFDTKMLEDLGQIFERWDGQGLPNRLKGEQLALPVRVIQVAEAAVTVQGMSGPEAAVTVLRERAGRLYDPTLVDAFRRAAPDLFAHLETASLWEAVIAAEPGPPVWLSNEEFDEAMLAVGRATLTTRSARP